MKSLAATVVFVLVVAGAAIADQGLAPGETRVMGGGSPRYDGEKVSIDFKDADVKDVLRFLADFGKFNLVLDASVQGKITIKLTNVPWDQALDVILRNNGLAADIEGGVVRAAGMSVLAREAAAERRLLEERELAAPLVTVTRAFSYAKVRDVAPLLERFLSRRGTIMVDARTNIIIVRDVPVVLGDLESAMVLQDR